MDETSAHAAERAVTVPGSPSVTERLRALTQGAAGADGERVILAAFADDAPPVRDRAIRYAARYVEPVRLVSYVARQDATALRDAATCALERQGPYAVPHLEQLLRETDDAALTMFALHVLGRIGTWVCAGAVLPFVNHPNPCVARAAIEALGRFRATEAVPALLEQLHGDAPLQLAAIEALGEIGDERAAEPLLRLLAHPRLAVAAARVLGSLPAEAILSPVASHLASATEPAMRDALIDSLARAIERAPAEMAIDSALVPLVAAAGEGSELLAHLRALVEGEPEPAGAGAAQSAAAVVVLAAPILPLWPVILAAAVRRGRLEPLAALVRERQQTLMRFVIQHLSHPSPPVRAAALGIGCFDRTSSTRLLDALDDHDAMVRAAACRALGELGEGAAVPVLIERFRSGDPVERAAAVEALSRMPSAALAELEQCLGPSSDEQVVAQVLEVLERAGGDPLADRVYELAAQGSPAIRRVALRVIAGLADRRADQVLLKALGDSHPAVQVESLDLLVRRGGERVADSLIGLLVVADSLRFRVIRALGRLRVARAAPRLSALYAECAVHERLEIVTALVLIRPADIHGFLHARLAEGDAEIRRAAARGLATLAGPDDLSLLLLLAEDPDWNVRNEAARALGRILASRTRNGRGGELARSALLALARDLETAVAATARESLAHMPLRGHTAA